MAQPISDDLDDEKRALLDAIEAQAQALSRARAGTSGDGAPSLEDFFKAADVVMPQSKPDPGPAITKGTTSKPSTRKTSMANESTAKNSMASLIIMGTLLMTTFIVVGLGYMSTQKQVAEMEKMRGQMLAQVQELTANVGALKALNQAAVTPEELKALKDDMVQLQVQMEKQETEAANARQQLLGRVEEALRETQNQTPWRAAQEAHTLQIQDLQHLQNQLVAKLDALQKKLDTAPQPPLVAVAPAPSSNPMPVPAKALQPAPKPWIFQQDSQAFVIQVGSLPTEADARLFIKNQHLSGDKVQIIQQLRKDEIRFNVFYGLYASKELMQGDYQMLKSKKLGAWGRKVEDVQKAVPRNY